MKTRMIGKLEVSAVGMGCMAFSHGYGQIPEEDYSLAAILALRQYQQQDLSQHTSYETENARHAIRGM